MIRWSHHQRAILYHRLEYPHFLTCIMLRSARLHIESPPMIRTDNTPILNHPLPQRPAIMRTIVIQN